MSGEGNRRAVWQARLERIMPGIYFLFVFFLYFSLLSEPTFTDEQDVLFGGYNIIKGKDIYRSFLSQHMPFSYYMAAPLALLGARTIYQYRLGIYVIMSLCWLGMYLRHRRVIPRVSLFAMPLLYLAIMKQFNLGSTMLSDHWQGVGLVMIMLEVIRYAEKREISLSCAVMVSLGILLSFGTVFISAYSVFCYFLAVAALQISFLRRGGKSLEWRRRVRGEDLRLVGICLLPFLLLGIWYAISGNLENFYAGAFEMVTQVYSKYAGGLGSDPVSVVWETLGSYAVWLAGAARNLAANPRQSLLILFEAVAMICFCVGQGRKNPVVGIAIFLATVYSGIRGFDSFHTMAYHAQTAAAIALGVGMIWRKTEETETKWGRKGNIIANTEIKWEENKEIKRNVVLKWIVRGATGVLAAVLLFGFARRAGYHLMYPQILGRQNPRAEERMLSLLTESGEEVHVCETPMYCQEVMNLELIPQDACGAISYPYFYEMWGEKQMESLREHPHILLYDPAERFSEYVFEEYAADFQAYVAANYTRLPMGEDVWVSNEFLLEALRRLREAGYGNRMEYTHPGVDYPRSVEYGEGESASQRFTAEGEHLSAVMFQAACFYGRRQPTLRLLVADAETGEIRGEAVMTPDQIADNYYSRCPIQAELTPGREYDLTITVEHLPGGGRIGIYYAYEGDIPLGLEYRD